MSTTHEAFAAAYDQLEAASTTEPPAEVAGGPASGGEPVEPVGRDGGDSGGHAETPAVADSPRARGADGKFVPKAAAAKAEAPKPVDPKAPPAPAKSATEPPKPGTETATPAVAPGAENATKAPQSWSPALREHWGKLPAEVQQQVAKREREIASALQESAPARKEAETYRNTIAPYRHLMTDAPEKVIGGLLQTAAALQQNPVAVVAQMIKGYKVPIEALAAALDADTTQPPAPSEYKDPRVDHLFAQIEQMKQQRQQVAAQRTMQEIEAFEADAANEFVQQGSPHQQQIRDLMANAHDVAQKGGLKLGLRELYDWAVQMHPEVKGVLQQRRDAESSANAGASMRQSRAASTSIKPQPAAPSGSAKPADTRGHMDVLYDEMSQRR